MASGLSSNSFSSGSSDDQEHEAVCHGDVPVQRIFQNLKRDLFINSDVPKASTIQPPEEFNASSSFKGACLLSRTGIQASVLSRG